MFEPHAMHDALKQFYAYRQGPNVTPQEYHEQFMNNVEVVAFCGGSIGMSPRLVAGTLADETGLDVSTLTKEERQDVRLAARERYLATAFILGADQYRYGKMIRDIENEYLFGLDKYPKTVTAAYNLLLNWKGDPSRPPRNIRNDGTVEHRSVCITLRSDEQHGRIPKTWILLHNQSTVDVFHNEALLKRIRVSDKGHLDIHCNAGVTSTNLVGDLPGYGTVWYHPKGIANILSLNKVKAKYCVTYDSTNGNAFTVHKKDGTVRIFQQSSRGLFYMDSAQTSPSQHSN
jgi:hypothetical protein